MLSVDVFIFAARWGLNHLAAKLIGYALVAWLSVL